MEIIMDTVHYFQSKKNIRYDFIKSVDFLVNYHSKHFCFVMNKREENSFSTKICFIIVVEIAIGLLGQ
jgi:hypothetical protein